MSSPTGEVVTSSLGETALIRASVFQRAQDFVDVPENLFRKPQQQILCREISDKEVYKATCQASSTPSGPDEIFAGLLAIPWPIIGKRIAELFRDCINNSTHPTIFRDDRPCFPKT